MKKLKKYILLKPGIGKGECNVNNKKRVGYFVCLILGVFLLILNPIVLASSSDGNQVENDPEKIFDDYFLIGLTELYFGSNKLEGNLEVIDGVEDFEEKVNKGRLTFYLKGKIKGKYLLTAWLDTEEKKLDELFSSLGECKINTPFEKLDPEKYYPIYGDSSTITSDVHTVGKLYLCLESEEFKALWGNYKVDFDSNELISFNRLCYGFNAVYQEKGSVNVFWHKPFSLHSRDVMEVTGGMLYYLKHDDLVIGTENLKLELRDATTNRVLKTIDLVVDQDYELNYLQGRIILKSKVDLHSDNDLIQDEEGNDSYYLIAEYDYNYDHQKNDNDGYGLETAYVVSDKAYISGTYIHEQYNDGATYQIYGFNLDYSPLKKTNFKVAWAKSENIMSGNYISYDGGLTYNEVALTDADNSSSAWNLELEQEITGIENGKFAGYYSLTEEGFSSGSKIVSEDEINYGFSLLGKIEDVTTRLSYDKKERNAEDTFIIGLNLNNKYNDKLDLEGEIRYKKVKSTEEKNNITCAIGFDYQLDENKNIYGSQQFTISKKNMARNDLTKLGRKLRHGKWIFNVEGTVGSDDSLIFGAGYQLNENSEIYTTIQRNFADKGEASTETTIGTKSKLNQDVEVYGEHRTDDSNKGTQESNVLGVDYSPLDNWLFTFDFSKSKVNKENDSTIDRNIISFGSYYNGQDIKYANRMECRTDSGNKDLEQFILTGDLSWQYNEEFTLLSEAEYFKENEVEEEKYIKGTIGAAYRPIELDRLNLIGKYTYLEEITSVDDEDETDNYPVEKAQVFAIEGIYDLTAKWQLAEKLAYKKGDVKLTTENENWITSETYLWINRLKYKWRYDIELFTEYRILANKLAEDKKSGFLLGVYKDFPKNMKLGLGYNFTDFNDDLTDLDYEAKGFFVNLIKAW